MPRKRATNEIELIGLRAQLDEQREANGGDEP
jgi:hypothetical protein